MRLALSRTVLDYDCEVAADHIARKTRQTLRLKLRRRGLVVAVSGGIDSSVCAALAVRAVGAKRVFGLLMPERESSPESRTRGEELVEHLGISYSVEDIAPALHGLGCYHRRDSAIRTLIPDYGPGWRSKIVIAGGSEGEFNRFNLVVCDPTGCTSTTRLGVREYLAIVAATNFKQRVRKTYEYYHADRLNYAVVGTPNRLEYDQGFFVKNGDGSADIKPIAHLFKTQVYAMARHLELPPRICDAVPTTDTYTLPQGQDEFYFALPYEDMDLALWARDRGVPVEELAQALNLSHEQARWIYADIDSKRRAVEYLGASPVLVTDENGTP